MDRELGKHTFGEYLRKRLGTASRSPLHELLSQKNFKAVITTNYDDLAEKYWTARGMAPFMVLPHTNHAQAALAVGAMSDPTSNQLPIITIHGSWNQPDSLVFGPRSYRDIMFANDGSRNFMANICGTYTVLFVGVSFRDPNLQSVLQWIYTSLKGVIPTHYATLENRGQVFKNYMKQNFNIRMLTYPVPPADHSKCLDILRVL